MGMLNKEAGDVAIAALGLRKSKHGPTVHCGKYLQALPAITSGTLMLFVDSQSRKEKKKSLPSSSTCFVFTLSGNPEVAFAWFWIGRECGTQHVNDLVPGSL